MPERLKCSRCGRRARRVCPAWEEPICSICCGSLRMSAVECPEDCPHNPFGIDSYDLFLSLCEKFNTSIVVFMLEHLDRDDVLDLLARLFYEEDMTDKEMIGAMPLCAYFSLIYGPHPEDHSTPLATIWEEMDWKGLDNDERVMMRYALHSFPAVIEIQRIEENRFLTCVDLLNPSAEPFILSDRTMAGRVSRFTRLLMWMTPFPCYHSGFGRATSIPEAVLDVLLEEIEEDVEEYSSDGFDFTKHDVLALSYGVYEQVMADFAREEQRRMLENIDIHPSMAIYSVQGDLSAVKEILEERQEFAFDDEEEKEGVLVRHYVWLRAGESKAIEQEMPASFRHDDEGPLGVVGSLHLADEQVLLNAQTTQLYEFAKSMIPKIFGDLLQFQEDLVMDTGKQMAEEIAYGEVGAQALFEGGESESEIPPEVERELMTEFYTNHYKAFLNDEVPALDGLTPREAAKQPEMRDKLVRLMKGHINNIEEANRRSDMDIDIDWVLRELGLEGLIEGES